MSRPLFGLLFLLLPCFAAQTDAGKSSGWRAATESELKEVIPARAQVEKERIETEFRTASGITDGKGKYVAGVQLITAGYSAEGKYSHYLLVQAPLKIGPIPVKPGNYLIGWRHKDKDSLDVKLYEAETGTLVGSFDAKRNSRIGRIESIHIYPPTEKALVQIGRFAFPYDVGGQ